MTKPELKDWVKCTTPDHGAVCFYGEVRAISYVLDNDNKVHLQYLVCGTDGNQVAVGAPLWEIKVVDRAD